MKDHADYIRPFLFAVRLLLWISAVITLGLTAWVVAHLKGYRAIFTLVIAVLTTVFYIPALFTACMHRNRGYMLPLDIIFYALWLSAFIFVAQTDDFLGGSGCSFFIWDLNTSCKRRNAIEAFSFLSFFWTFCGLCLEIANVYIGSWHTSAITHPEKPNGAISSGANGATATTPSAGSAPGMNGEPAQV
ncbi:uncharacterized protein N7469_003132 [Penicillium citrinum]|jgi:hypothetical protein|uniref:MARVEL domain-containing protein n=2 Tax=Penicillium TaxID=5073 RepID=A0A9W9PCN2_PENCI|nr:uncharacterized protein N7469_003132 [Penicillium citrinum]KAJ5241541.1 hypothetical protein N7469_003132 [Penicillium citrinum]KAJ5586550.1 hypothetical protein N7450_006337 [Penicillium hetheringtonii]KAK5789104.1 hypothetical protein VI817_008228 [Penicillium citrinum]